jgi:hypothetical protein
MALTLSAEPLAEPLAAGWEFVTVTWRTTVVPDPPATEYAATPPPAPSNTAARKAAAILRLRGGGRCFIRVLSVFVKLHAINAA